MISRYKIYCCVFALCFFAGLNTGAITLPVFLGMKLEAALQELQTQGMNILYSSDLVRPDMLIRKIPQSGPPHRMLHDLLLPFGLMVRNGPEQTLLIVPISGSATPRGGAGNDSQVSGSKSAPLAENVVVPFVTIFVTAQDAENQFVSNLTAEDFVVLEDGKEQPIVDFLNLSDPSKLEENKIPATVCFVIDSSQSMNWPYGGKKRFDLIQEGALKILDELRPGDQAMVIGFNETPWIVSEPTADIESVRGKLRDFTTMAGKTAIYDSLFHAVTRMNELSGRKLIVLFSDGEDTASQTSMDDLLHTLEASDSTIVVLGTTFQQRPTREDREALEKISRVTGGHSFFLSSASDLKRLMKQVRTVIHGQYAAGYTPPEPAIRRLRQVRVECKIPGIQLRYRTTYFF